MKTDIKILISFLVWNSLIILTGINLMFYSLGFLSGIIIAIILK